MVKKCDIFFPASWKEFAISSRAAVDDNGHENGKRHGIGNGNASTMRVDCIELD